MAATARRLRNTDCDPVTDDLTDEHRRARTGRIDHLEFALLGISPYLGRHSMRGEDAHRAVGNLFFRVHEHGPAFFELADDVPVVDDLLPDVDGGPERLQRALDDLDCSVHAGAVAAGRRQDDLLHEAIVEGVVIHGSQRLAGVSPECRRYLAPVQRLPTRGTPAFPYDQRSKTFAWLR